MCGIVGRLNFDINHGVEEASIRRMADKIIHRGPDADGYYVKNNIGLGHRRLAIIDLSPAGRNPMFDKEKTIALVFNGEIYNFQSLRKDLEKKGYIFQSNTDTEVIIYLWKEYGKDCLKYLRGMFAFALWDDAKKVLFMARDRLGKKPLKYFLGENFIIFASELKAFIDEPDVPKEMDFEAIHHYLTFQYVPHPMTGFKGVKKLAPAHYLHIQLTPKGPEIEEKRYWSLDYSNPLHLEEQEWEERILSKLEESVKLRMISDVPLGAFLSGGVDSSAVVAMMAKNSTKPIKTFSIGFKEQAFNELGYARQIAERYETDHKEFIVEPQTISLLPKIVYHYEEPYADSSALPTFQLAEMTRQHVTVALNGDGGDENFAGYPWYPVMKWVNRYQKLPFFLKALNSKLVGMTYKIFPIHFLRYGELIARNALKGAHDVHTELLSYFNGPEKESFYEDSFKEKSKSWDSALYLKRYYPADYLKKDSISAALLADINTYLPDDLLAKVDIAAMACSLEARSPLLDHEFMQLMAQMPSSLKVHHGEKKYIFKKALKNLLPYDLMYRKKQGFSIPIESWFKSSLKEYSENLLLGKEAFQKGLFREEGIRDLLKKHQKNHSEGRRIWALITLKLWMDQFFK